MKIWLALSLQYRATLASTIFSQLLRMTGSVTSNLNPFSKFSNQCNHSKISMDGSRSWAVNKFSRILTQLQVWWTCTTSILIPIHRMTNIMLSTQWLVLEVNKKKWSNSKRPTCRCNKCKWCSNSKCSNNKCSSLIQVVSRPNSSTARCSRCSSSNSSNTKGLECKTNIKCNNSNSHSGQHSSNLALRMRRDSRRPTQEALAISARSSLHLKTTIRQMPVNTTMDWSILAQDNKRKLLLEEDSPRRMQALPHSRI